MIRPPVHGLVVDDETRCVHYRSLLDIVAMRFRCCDRYYACRECHDICESHPAMRWPRAAFDEPAVLCGACGAELTVYEYLACHDACPRCGAGFNPGCAAHRGRYFATM